MRPAAAALVLVALIGPGVAVAGEKTPKSSPVREAGQCVKRARDDQRACIRTETERCRTRFEADLGRYCSLP